MFSLLFFVHWLVPPPGAAAGGTAGLDGELVSVELFTLLKPQQLVITARYGQLQAESGAGRQLGQQIKVNWQPERRLWVQPDGADGEILTGLTIRNPSPAGFCRLQIEAGITRDFSGCFRICSGEDGLQIVNVLPLGEYLEGVAASEGDAGSALAAQVVVARTYAWRNRGRHGGFDFCDTTHCQLYQGRRKVTTRLARLVESTADEVLAFEGKLCQAFYHSTCGGCTNSFDTAWGGPEIPYLMPVEDAALCSASPFARWEFHLPAIRLARMLGAPAGEAVTRLDLTTALHGWVREVYWQTGGNTSGRLSGEEFRIRLGRQLGWNTVRSACFTVRAAGDEWVFTGRGQGHGVGLCQWGAATLAGQGQDYRQILAHYFPGARVQKWR